MQLQVCVLVKDRPSYLAVQVTAPPSRPRRPLKTHYAVLSMDRDLTQARSKRVKSWLSDALVPVSGLVEDAYFFGDLAVTLAAGNPAPADNATDATPSETLKQ
jgi:hypothetical protein